MLLTEDQMIYSMRFPKVKIEDTETDAPSSPGKIKAGLADVYDRFRERMARPEDPQKVEKGKQLVQRAKELAQAFEIDMDALRGHRCYRVILYLDYGVYMGELPGMLAGLLALCDNFALFRRPDKEQYINLDLTCHTYKSYMEDVEP